MRYRTSLNNESNKTLPFVKLDIKSTDKYVVYKEGESRLDIFADEYWNRPDECWLILLANPEFGGLEWNIPDQTILRIPYPYDATINEYNTKIKELI